MIRTSTRKCLSASGFTLVEVMVAATLFMVIIAATLAGMMHLMRREARHTAQLIVDGDAHRLAAFLRTSLRLTDEGRIQFHPPEGPPYTAIAYPVPCPVDPWPEGTNAINWGRTVILHTYVSGDRHQLLATQWEHYDPNVDFAALAPGPNSRILAETDLSLPLTFNVHPEANRFDSYAATPRREPEVRFGGVRLHSGDNTLRFTLVGKRDESGGYGLRLDRLRLSPAGLPIEAEALFPPQAQSGATLAVVEAPSQQWSDRRYLAFPATASNDWFELNVYNDTWHETLFRHPGSVFEKCRAVVSTDPGDVGVHLVPDGRETTWLAEFQAGQSGVGATEDDPYNLRGAAVRVIVRGSAAEGGGHVLARGEGCVVTFRASDWEHSTWQSRLRIQAARIAEAADPLNPTSAIKPETTTELRFGNPPVPHVVINQGESATSAPASLAIDPEKSYVISFWINPAADPFRQPYPWTWPVLHDTNRVDTYVMPMSTTPSPSPSRLEDVSWDEDDAMLPYASILAVAEIRTTFPAEAVYVSRIIDTSLDAPTYGDIDWNASTPSGSSIQMRLRSGSAPNLSDAPDWSSISALNEPGPLPFGVGQGRYLQVHVTLLSDPDAASPPVLRDFTVRWPGAERVMDFDADFGQFPEGGIVEVTVNDTPPTAALQIDLDLGGRAPPIRLGDDSPVRASLRLETTPRN